MAVTQVLPGRRWNWRTIGYAVLAGFFALQSLLLGIFFMAPSPWRSPDLLSPWLTKWHVAGTAVGVGLFTGVGLLLTLWDPPAKASLLQVNAGLVLGMGIPVALLRIAPLGFELGSWVTLLLFGLLLALYPAPRALVSLSGTRPISKPLLVLAIVASVLLLPDIWRNLQWQVSGIGGESARRYFWLEAALFDIALIGAGLLTAIGRPGWRYLGLLLAAAYIYLGIVALIIPDEMGSWGTIGGALSILAGIAYALLVAREWRA